MATLPSASSLTSATTTNAQQKTNFTDLRTFLADLLGTDSANKVAARAALGAIGVNNIPAALANNGYVIVPTSAGNLIVQWGSVSVTVPNAGFFAASYPVRFPVRCFAVIGVGDATGTSAMVKANPSAGDIGGAMIIKNYGTGTEPFAYIAVGY